MSEQNWIETLRLSESLKDSETDRNPLWPLLCDVVEAAARTDLQVSGIYVLEPHPLERALAALRAEVEK